MDQIKSKLGQWELREWRDFADIGRFKLPTGATLQPRVVTNVQYYAVNYLVIALAALLVVVLFRPLILVVLAAEGAFVGYLYSAARVPDGLILLPAPLASLSGRRTVPRILLVIASAGVSLLLMLIFGGVVLLMGYIVGAGGTLRNMQSLLKHTLHCSLQFNSIQFNALLASILFYSSALAIHDCTGFVMPAPLCVPN
eukprot:TRINITY_DN8477_c0_g1_i2.p1 TRINITY_DN8477_c0_g1~~TRINITY_DN8477_c0_g1_i2.p1  ORF type:complete len:198 (+),score=46.88 TRINITY_DN8477_c0_g1_i2:342-935(+)